MFFEQLNAHGSQARLNLQNSLSTWTSDPFLYLNW